MFVAITVVPVNTLSFLVLVCGNHSRTDSFYSHLKDTPTLNAIHYLYLMGFIDNVHI